MALALLLAGASTSAPPESSRHPVEPDSSVEQVARAALPDSVKHLLLATVSSRKGGEYEAFVTEIQGAYDTGQQMSYLVTVTYYESDNAELNKLREGWTGAEPALTVQGHDVYKRAYGGMGSGVALFLPPEPEGGLHTVIQVRSPRLTDAARKQAAVEQRSDAPPPEAVLQEMNVSAFRALAAQLR